MCEQWQVRLVCALLCSLESSMCELWGICARSDAMGHLHQCIPSRPTLLASRQQALMYKRHPTPVVHLDLDGRPENLKSEGWGPRLRADEIVCELRPRSAAHWIAPSTLPRQSLHLEPRVWATATEFVGKHARDHRCGCRSCAPESVANELSTPTTLFLCALRFPYSQRVAPSPHLR